MLKNNHVAAIIEGQLVNKGTEQLTNKCKNKV